MDIAGNDRFQRMRERVNARLMNQTYRIYPYAEGITESGAIAGQTTLGEPLLYKGKPDIPCRLDVARHFRETELEGQEVIPGEFELHVPSDAPLLVNHAVIIDGRSFEVVKEYDFGTAWSPDKYAIIADLQFTGSL